MGELFNFLSIKLTKILLIKIFKSFSYFRQVTNVLKLLAGSGMLEL